MQRNLHHALASFKDGGGGYKARSMLASRNRKPRQLKKTGALVRKGTELIEKWKVSRRIVSDSAIPWTVARHVLCPWNSRRQEYWSGLPFPSPYNLNKSKSGFILRASRRSAALMTAWFWPHEDSKQRTSWATPGPGIWHTDNTLYYLFFKHLFTSLAALGLSCGMWNFSFFLFF